MSWTLRLTTNGRETRVIPSLYQLLVYEPMKLALREKGINEVETTEVPDLNRTNAERLNHPLILRVAIAVLVRTKCMRDTLERIHDRASEVVGWVDLPFIPMPSVSTKFM
jgi:hypothetical protein